MKRLFENGNYTEACDLAMNEANVMFMDLLHALETHVGDTVDLRDFHYAISSTIHAFVCDLSIGRRLGSPDDQPREIMRSYTRLNVMPMVRPSDQDDVPWECDESPNGSCEYEDLDDELSGSCMHCGDLHKCE